MLETGFVLMQRFEVQRKLGQGGTAQVYLAFDRDSERNRVLKEVRKAADKQGYISVRREAELVWKLKYPYFPEVFEVFETEEAEYLVMEYLEGETLGERLRRLGPQPCTEVRRWGKDLCLMIDYLHQCLPALIYQDMKPDNVMIQPRGNLRLIDFGAVLIMQSGEQQKRLGTRGYAAPEQFDCEKAVDARTDIYSLGQTMYQLLTGNNPGECGWKSSGFRREKIPGKMGRILRKCVSENPADRYQNCQELLKALCGN